MSIKLYNTLTRKKEEFKPIEDEKPDDTEPEEPPETPEIVDPGEGIYISEAENIYNDFKEEELFKVSSEEVKQNVKVDFSK